MDEKTQPSRPELSHLPSTHAPWVAMLCLVIAVAAQQRLDQHGAKSVALLAYGLAAIAFGVLLRHTAIESRTRLAAATGRTLPSPAVLRVTLGLSLLGCLDFGDNQFRPLGLALWIGGLLLTLLYLWMLSPVRAPSQYPRQLSHRKTLSIPIHWFVLVAILLVGAWFRFRLLSEIPADLGPDLIHNYWNTLDILEGKYPVMFGERESLIFYCTALCAQLVGLSQWTLHLTSALVGTASIVALYALGTETFDKRVGLMAALLLAVNRSHILLSRSGYRAILTPLFTILALYSFIRALKGQQLLRFFWAGIALGLGFYTYRTSLFLPLVVLAGLALHLTSKGWSEVRCLLPGLALMVCVFVVVLAPMARLAVEQPKEYFARELVALRLKREQEHASSGVAAYYWRSALAFNWEGDGISRWNVPGARHMGFVSGMLMVLGLGYTLLRWRHGYNSFVLALWFLLILPDALSMLPNSTPNSLRLSGTIGPAILLAALPLPLIDQQIQSTISRRKLSGNPPSTERTTASPQGLAISLTVESAKKHYAWKCQPCLGHVLQLILCLTVTVLLAYETQEASRFCFHDFVARAPDRANYSHSREIARQIEHYGDLKSAYVKAWPYWFDGGAVRVSLRVTDRTWDPVVDALAPDQPPLSTIQGSALFIVHPDDHEAMETLDTFFRRGLTVPRYYPDGTLSFYTFYGER